VFGLVVGIV